MTAIPKAVLSFEEFKRLKNFEKLYEECNQELQQLKKRYEECNLELEQLKKRSKVSNEDSVSGLQEKQSNQTGFGVLDIDSIKKIAELVKQELVVLPTPIASNWKSYERAEPTIVSNSVPIQEANDPYTTIITKDKPHDQFDSKKLIATVPKQSRYRAKLLLDDIEKRPNELSFNTSGTIFIDTESIPNSNIYKVFRYLFKSKIPKKLTGFDDLLNKITEMELQRFIVYPIQQSQAKKIESAIKKTIQSIPSTSKNYWYLG